MIFINKYTIKPSPTFEKELKRIYKHLAFKLKEPVIAQKFYERVIKEIYSLQYFPERYAKISNYKNKTRNLRKLLINNYIIIYEVNKDTRPSFYFTYISFKSKLF